MKDQDDARMSRVERLILKNQFAILEILTRAHPEIAEVGNVIYHDASIYRWYQELLEGGYEVLLSEITQHIWETTLNKDEQIEILNILDMWRHIQSSYDGLQDKDGLTEDDVQFDGWDGNSMKGEMGFARAFCYRRESKFDDEGEPDRYGMIRPGPAINSHFPTMEMYRRMLQVYRPIRRAGWRPLTAAEIRALLGARANPDYREL